MAQNLDAAAEAQHESAIKPNALVWAHCCCKRRPAKNCHVQHYYDVSYIWCDDGKGCKSKGIVRRAAKMRSIAAKAGWRTRRKEAAIIKGERSANR